MVFKIRSNLKIQKGFSLIEMLMTLAIFSVVLSSLSYIQFQNTQATGNQYFEQVALNLIHNAYEQCQVSQLTCADATNVLKTEARKQLPKGDGKVMSDSQHIYIGVSWLNRFEPEKNNEVTLDV